MSRICWCGNASLAPFSPDYNVCHDCGTLVSTFEHANDVSRVHADDADLYGKDYWFGHMEDDLGFPNIFQRARLDLVERCPYWLKAVLKYRTPPGRVLELGSAHGGFVALLRLAGYDATGLELSPSIAQLARDLFQVPMLCGPIEDQQIAAATLDVVAMMDVLEHLPDPVATMYHVVRLIAPNGFILIQTPRYVEGRSFESLVQSNDVFLQQLKPNEHLYIFSERAAARLFAALGLNELHIEPALFSHYDMFFTVSVAPLGSVPDVEQERSVTATRSGRMALALLDLYDTARASVPRALLDELEADRAARLAIIERQGEEMGQLTHANAVLQADADGFRTAYEFAEADRAARLEIIEQQRGRLDEEVRTRISVEAEADALRAAFETVKAEASVLRDAFETVKAEASALRDAFEAAEADRAARLQVIEEQGRRVGVAEQLSSTLRAETDALRQALDASEADRAARLTVIEAQGSQLADAGRTLNQVTDELHRTLERLHESARENIDLIEQSETLRRTIESLERRAQRRIFKLILDRMRGRP